ncbi:hypothetical protein [Streptomyces atriruber]|uniref:hypothetical protein n=1 Tax=Streptomyces atriruber TaxID=545121 RepID=UPI0006E2E455|nr:hypothetical protein [Streptomyces atriruber]
MRLKLLSAAAGLAALLTAGLTAPAAQAADDVQVLASRNVTAKTSDRAPGGYMSVKVSYFAQGVDQAGDTYYRGSVRGHVEDLEGDGYCARAQAWYDGVTYNISDAACPKGNARPAASTFDFTYRALVRVCLWKGNRVHYCSSWK